MKKLLGIVVLGLLLCTSVYAIEDDKPLTEKDLENIQPSESRLEAILEFFKESVENKTPIDPDAAADQFGYESFEEFAKEYLKVMKLTDISVDEIREYLSGTDEIVIIDQSQKNLDRLHSLIINDKYFRKKTNYFKEKYKYKDKMLAVYINFEKEMEKITKNPNLEKISRFDFRFWWYTNQPESYVKKQLIADCKKSAAKYKLFGGECIIVEKRNASGFKNLLKPDPKIEEKNEILLAKKIKKEKKKIKKEKKKEVSKTKEAAKPIDLIIPVQVYIVQINVSGFKSTTTPEDVKKDFKVANSIWNAHGIQFEAIDIVKSKGNAKSLEKNLKWVKDKYLQALRIDRKKQKIKSNNQKKYRKVLHKLISGTTNRNKKAINLFYLPHMPGNFACGIAYSYSRILDSRTDPYKRKNAGYALIGEKNGCKSNGIVVAHELGHMFSLGHKEVSKVDLMMWGGGTKIHDWQADKLKKYYKKYLKRKLTLN